MQSDLSTVERKVHLFEDGLENQLSIGDAQQTIPRASEDLT
jgi:hypothetical protein